jgi:hypothetical protein
MVQSRDERAIHGTETWQRCLTATGNRIHWVRSGQRYALCGSLAPEPSTGTGDTPPNRRIRDCESCARKFAKLRSR